MHYTKYSKFIAVAVGISLIGASAFSAFAWGNVSANSVCVNNEVVLSFHFQNNTTQTTENVTVSGPFLNTYTFTVASGQYNDNSNIPTNQSVFGGGSFNFHIVYPGGSEDKSASIPSITCQPPTPTNTPMPTETPFPTSTPTPFPTSTPQPTPTTAPATPTPTGTSTNSNNCDGTAQNAQNGSTNNNNCNQNKNNNQNNNTNTQSQTQSNSNDNSGNSTNNINVNPSISNNVTLTSYAPPSPVQSVEVAPAPVTNKLPSTGSPLAETLAVAAATPLGFFIRKFKKLG